MRVNVGMMDRLARCVIGIALIAYAVPVGFPSTGWNWLGWIGVVPLATAFFGVCPLYSVLGLSTCPAPASKGRACQRRQLSNEESTHHGLARSH